MTLKRCSTALLDKDLATKTCPGCEPISVSPPGGIVPAAGISSPVCGWTHSTSTGSAARLANAALAVEVHEEDGRRRIHTVVGLVRFLFQCKFARAPNFTLHAA